VGQGDVVAPGPRRKAAGNSHSTFDAHVGHVGILAGGCDFAKDEERPIGFDLDSHRGVADVAAAQPGGDRGRKFRPVAAMNAWLQSEEGRQFYSDDVAARTRAQQGF
jgi:hypothetical protein